MIEFCLDVDKVLLDRRVETHDAWSLIIIFDTETNL